MAMNLDDQRWIDWSHEREWRWCDPNRECNCPGLPIWLDKQPIRFSRPLIMVREDREVRIVLDKIKELYDANSGGYSETFDRAALRNTRVFSLERLSLLGELAKLDDLSSSQLATFDMPKPSPAYIRRLRYVLDRASNAAAQAAERYRASFPRSPTGDYQDVFGFASLMFHAPQSEFTEALLLLNAVSVFGRVGYRIEGVFERHCQTGRLTELEDAAHAAERVLRESYSDVVFSVRSRMD